MKITTYGLLLVGAGVIINGFANYSNSRKTKYLQEQHMAGKVELEASIGRLTEAIEAERKEAREAHNEQQAVIDQLKEDAANGHDLTDSIAKLDEATAKVKGIIDRPAPVVGITEDFIDTETEGEAVPDPATDVVAEPETEVANGE